MSVNRRRRARGFLLIEAMVGSALLTVALMAIFQHLAFMERQVSESSKRTQAQMALWDGINRFRGRDYGSISTGGPTTDNPPNVAARRTTITNVTTTDCHVCRRIYVEVDYKTALGVTRTITATTYVPSGF
ncbi:MAG: hypothetical protein AB2A00_39755 [Myxococcota bacterium]